MVSRLIPAVALILGWSLAARASAPGPLTTLHAIHGLTNAEASRGLPVAFVATVTYYRGYENNLFVQDGDAAIYVGASTDLHLIPGDRVLVRGTTQKSFNPIVIAKSVKMCIRDRAEAAFLPREPPLWPCEIPFLQRPSAAG